MSVESITRKKLGTTYGDIKFVCCLGNVAIFECEENGDDPCCIQKKRWFFLILLVWSVWFWKNMSA